MIKKQAVMLIVRLFKQRKALITEILQQKTDKTSPALLRKPQKSRRIYYPVGISIK